MLCAIPAVVGFTPNPNLQADKKYRITLKIRQNRSYSVADTWSLASGCPHGQVLPSTP